MFEGVAKGQEFKWGSNRIVVLDAGAHVAELTAGGRQWLLRNTNISWKARLAAGSETALKGDPKSVYTDAVDTGGIDDIFRNMKGTMVDGKMLTDHGPAWGVLSPARLERVNGEQVIVNELVADGLKLRREIVPLKSGAQFRYVLTALPGPKGSAKSAYYAPHIKLPVDAETRVLMKGRPEFRVDEGSTNIPGVDTSAVHRWPKAGHIDLSKPGLGGPYHAKTHVEMPKGGPVAQMTVLQGKHTLDITWDSETLPNAGNWFNNSSLNFGAKKRGRPAPPCRDMGLEPTNGFSDDPNFPANRAKVPRLKPGQSLSFWYQLEGSRTP